MPASGVLVDVLQAVVAFVADVRVPVPIQSQGSELADLIPDIQGLDLPVGGVWACYNGGCLEGQRGQQQGHQAEPQ